MKESASLTLRVSELLVNLFIVIEEARKKLNSKTRVQSSSGCPDAVHAQLWYAGIYSPTTHSAREHWSDGPAASNVVTNLEDLQLRPAHFRDALENCRRDGVGRHVAVRVSRYRYTNIQSRCMVREICIHEVRVDCMRHIRGYEEGVGVCLRDKVCTGRWRRGKESTIRSMVLGRKLLRAPCRSRLPISSSSNKPTHLIIPEVDSLAVPCVCSKSACTADQEHSLSSTRPP